MASVPWQPPRNADEVLREFRQRTEASGVAGCGRALGSGAARPSALADVDRAFAEAEDRMAAIDLLAEAPERRPPHGRRSNQPATKPTCAPSVARLTELEREARSLAQGCAALRERVGGLERQAEAVDAAAAGDELDAGAPSAAPQRAPAGRRTEKMAVVVRGRQHAGLGGALQRREAQLRAQAEACHAEMASLREREDALIARLKRAGAEPDKENAESNDADGGVFSPGALLAHLRGINDAVTKSHPPAQPGGGGRVHGMGALGRSPWPMLPLTVFADGLMLRRGPFRKYTEPAAAAFVAEAMAGCLPYELKQAYPDGVVFELFDQRHETHAAAAAAAPPRGGAPGGARAVASLSDARGGAALLAPQPSESLLRRLPERVVRDGQVVPVRAELDEMLRGGARIGGHGRAVGAPPAAPPAPESPTHGHDLRPRNERAPDAVGGAGLPEHMSTMRAARLRRFEQAPAAA